MRVYYETCGLVHTVVPEIYQKKKEKKEKVLGFMFK